MEEILKAMNNYYKDKTFIYKSKYGGVTEGICKKVISVMKYTTNESIIDTLKGFDKSVDTFASVSEKIKTTLTEEVYLANRIEYIVVSDKGVEYELTEIYFKN